MVKGWKQESSRHALARKGIKTGHKSATEATPKELKTTGEYFQKKYKCTRCGNIELQGTNHWGEIYPHCDKCSWKNPMDPNPTWVCLEKMPKGYKKPPAWTKVRLKDIATVTNL